MTKVIKVEASKEGSVAVVTLDDSTQHVLQVMDYAGAKVEISADAASGELADYLESIPVEFRDEASDIEEAYAAGSDFEVIYAAA